MTPEEEIERKEFPADDEGLCQITDWINEKGEIENPEEESNSGFPFGKAVL